MELGDRDPDENFYDAFENLENIPDEFNSIDEIEKRSDVEDPSFGEFDSDEDDETLYDALDFNEDIPEGSGATNKIERCCWIEVIDENTEATQSEANPLSGEENAFTDDGQLACPMDFSFGEVSSDEDDKIYGWEVITRSEINQIKIVQEDLIDLKRNY